MDLMCSRPSIGCVRPRSALVSRSGLSLDGDGDGLRDPTANRVPPVGDRSGVSASVRLDVVGVTSTERVLGVVRIGIRRWIDDQISRGDVDRFSRLPPGFRTRLRVRGIHALRDRTVAVRWGRIAIFGRSRIVKPCTHPSRERGCGSEDRSSTTPLSGFERRHDVGGVDDDDADACRIGGPCRGIISVFRGICGHTTWYGVETQSSVGNRVTRAAFVRRRTRRSRASSPRAEADTRTSRCTHRRGCMPG
ncbi:hypothetical protein SAMN05192561_104137 [Halopenitus malekzadehii]|uniref:Uncharacterized protein n=1 Tax=Halopenitus malekzadehii TaxID=1267564 RepID=A0A1H6IW93_9EURY|nr:hypothetical protein SAMN05192561_104137 [Halopenitus malekzadehii]